MTAESPEALRGLGAQVLAKLGDGVVQLGAAFGENLSKFSSTTAAAPSWWTPSALWPSR